MGRVTTNTATLQVARENAAGAFGELPTSPVWLLQEWDEIGAYGPTITTVARNPVSTGRQRRKGSITDLDAAVEFTTDLTMDLLQYWAESYLLAHARNKDLFFRQADAAADGFTVAALSTDAAAKLLFSVGGPTSLLYARNYVTSANNGLKAVAAAVDATDTTIEVAGNSVETAPSTAIVELAGVRASASDLSMTIVASMREGTLTSAGDLDFTTLGLTPGQFIHIGGLTATNQFAEGADLARIKTVSATEVTLDKTGDGLVDGAYAAGSLQVDLLFGQFIRNVTTDDAEFEDFRHQFELAYPGLADDNVTTEYEYALGNLGNELTINFPLTDKSTVELGLIGTDADALTTTRKTGASTAFPPARTAAFNTTSDFVRLRVAGTDASGLTTDLKEVTITINNNVSPEKILARLGARYMNPGNVEVGIATQAIFTSADVPAAIRQNRTVSMEFALQNDDGGFVIDVPSTTLGGGDKEFPVGESVLINLEAEAFGDALLDTSLSVSMFAALP